MQRTRHQNDSILWRHRCGCSCSCCCSFRCLLCCSCCCCMCVCWFFFVFPTVALSFTYRPAARTSLCACPGRLPRLPSKRFTTLLPTAFAAHICNIVSANWAYDCVCVTLSVCVCVCVLLALNKTNTGTRRESWQKQQRMPHTFVFIMLNVSWGQQDHTHTTH